MVSGESIIENSNPSCELSPSDVAAACVSVESNTSDLIRSDISIPVLLLLAGEITQGRGDAVSCLAQVGIVLGVVSLAALVVGAIKKHNSVTDPTKILPPARLKKPKEKIILRR